MNIYMYLVPFFLLGNLITDLLAQLVQQDINEVKLMGLIPF